MTSRGGCRVLRGISLLVRSRGCRLGCAVCGGRKGSVLGSIAVLGSF